MRSWAHSVNDHTISGVCTYHLGWHKRTSKSQYLRDAYKAWAYLVVRLVCGCGRTFLAFEGSRANYDLFKPMCAYN